MPAASPHNDKAVRYARHIVLKDIGGAGQAALAKARVAIVGMGGLGCPLAQYLVAAGVGTIGLIDDDYVALSNLHRQILYKESDIGQLKTACAATHLAALNSDCQITPHPIRLTQENITLLQDYDIIADASDNFATRFLVSDFATQHKKILVSAACVGFEGHISTFTPKAPLTYRDFVPSTPPEADNICATHGIIGAVAGVVGALQALEVIKEITGAGESLVGRVLIYDGRNATTRLVALSPNKSENK